MALLILILLFLLGFCVNIVLIGLYIYGVVLGFRKKWYMGLAALMFSPFGVSLGMAKYFFKTDLLNKE